MNKLASVLFAATLILSPAAWAQSTQDLPSAPTPMTPRFPGAPAPKPTQPAAADSTQQTATPPAAQAAPQAEIPSAEGEAQQVPDKPRVAPLNDPQKPAPTQSTQDDLSADFHIGVDVDLVNLIFTATDKHGHFIKDLKQSDVTLLDEGKPPLRIEAFESETGLPLRVGLLIDASNSIRDRFRFEQDAAVEFLHDVVRPRSDQAFTLGFDSILDLTQDFTDQTNLLSNGVRVLRPGGGTALHDAIIAACDKLSKVSVRGPARRAIILLSDGDDNHSAHTREEAVEAALRAEVIIYVISTNISDSDKKGDKVLMRYADATGGRVFFPLRIEELSSAFSEIQDELRSQYVVAYKPQNFSQDGRYRPITLSAPGRNNVKLRARKGYYAPGKKQ